MFRMRLSATAGGGQILSESGFDHILDHSLISSSLISAAMRGISSRTSFMFLSFDQSQRGSVKLLAAA
jgi:hypothetical protein